MAKKAKEKQSKETLQILMSHYTKGSEDMDKRRTRKNGWNDVINGYMGKLPANWPYTSMVTDPRIRTTILEKTARLLNSKLQGRLIPREGGDNVKAKINNAILDFQWDQANEGGSMVEKVASCDQTARIFGAAFVMPYWDNIKNSNELKVIDPRDIFIDPAANHIRNAKWVQIREFTTLDALEARGYDVTALKSAMEENKHNDRKDTRYESVVKQNRGIEDRTGDDIAYDIIEVVTEWTKKDCTLFAPKLQTEIKKKKNPYKHGQIPVAMLRYYPLGDDIYGESEVESVLPLQRAINAILCGFIDEMNNAMRPPVKIAGAGVRMETIEYGPGAKWIMNDINQVQELQMGQGAIANFNNTYPALVAAFNTAMGDQSLGVSNIKGYQTDKTATEVASTERQQNSRDQYNQLYLAEFLKEIMMMWLSNNKQYLFDDSTKNFYIQKIVGKDVIKELQQLKLDDTDIPDEAFMEIARMIEETNGQMDTGAMKQIIEELAVPTNPVVENPGADPSQYKVRRKLEVKEDGDAELFVTPDDFEGLYDYVPDVKSMAAGAGILQQQARKQALEFALDKDIMAQLQTTGQMLDIKELITASLEDAGFKDAESLFKDVKENIPGGSGITQPSQAINQLGGIGAVPTGGQAVPDGSGTVGLPQANGLLSANI